MNPRIGYPDFYPQPQSSPLSGALITRRRRKNGLRACGAQKKEENTFAVPSDGRGARTHPHARGCAWGVAPAASREPRADALRRACGAVGCGRARSGGSKEPLLSRHFGTYLYLRFRGRHARDSYLPILHARQVPLPRTYRRSEQRAATARDCTQRPAVEPFASFRTGKIVGFVRLLGFARAPPAPGRRAAAVAALAASVLCRSAGTAPLREPNRVRHGAYGAWR